MNIRNKEVISVTDCIYKLSMKCPYGNMDKISENQLNS